MTTTTPTLKCAECGSSSITNGVCRKCGATVAGVSLVDEVQRSTASGKAGITAGHTTGRTSATSRTSGMSVSGSSSTVLGSTTVRRQKLGYGLVDLPAPLIASEDRFAALRAAERDVDVVARRITRRGLACGNCKKPVGRIKGFCRFCATAYDYSPLQTLAIIDEDPEYPGSGSRAVGGFLGAGAMGAVYCVWNFMVRPDRDQLALLQAVIDGTNDGAELHGRAEVVKVVLNATNKAQAAAAIAEMESATRVEHPNMARLYQFFVGRTAAGTAVNCMAMEYVPGSMLARMREDNKAPLPLAQSIALVLPLTGLLNYLHGTAGYTLTDIKGDNVIFAPIGAKVVDAGGLHQIGTGGLFQVAPLYAAPEIRKTGPTPVTDVFALFQMLGELAFAGFGTSTDADKPLPNLGADPVFPDTYMGLTTRKVFARGLHADPRKRFYADEAETQLLGLLRQLTADPKNPRLFESQLFGPDIGEAIDPTFSTPDQQTLPVLRPDTTDLGYSLISSADAIPITQRTIYFDEALKRIPESAELRWAALNALMAVAASHPVMFSAAKARLDQASSARNHRESVAFTLALKEREAAGVRIRDEDKVFAPNYDWREDWFRGRIAMGNGDYPLANEAFSRVDDWLPGELAPKLAMAMALEKQEQWATAAKWYAHVWQVDQSYKTAAFGLVRCNVRSSALSTDSLTQVAAVLDSLQASGERLAIHRLRAELFLRAIVIASTLPGSSSTLAGVKLEKSALRFAAEREYLRCCAYATSRAEMALYLRLAGKARPVTMW